MWKTPTMDSYETIQDKYTILKNPVEQAEAAAAAAGDDMSKIDHQFLNGGAMSKSQDNFLNKNETSAQKKK